MDVEIKIEEIQEYLPHRYPFLLVDRVIEMEPKDPTVWYLKSMALQELSKHEEANKCFERAIELGFQPPKKFLDKEKPDGLTGDEIREFQDNEEKLEDEELKKVLKEKK